MGFLTGIWNALPVWAQKFVTDFWTAFLVGLAGFTIVVPTGDYRNWAIAVGIAFANVVINALRRAIGGRIPGIEAK
jgi:hypothetical protein